MSATLGAPGPSASQRSGLASSAARMERSLETWGRGLFQAVFDHGDHRDRFRDLMAVAAPEPRLLTVASSDSDLLRLPWELIADLKGALSQQGVTVRRQLETSHAARAFAPGRPVRVLLVVSRPDDAGFIDPRHSSRALLDALAPLAAQVQVDFCRPPTLDRMTR